jgi:hypothetical protein
VKRQTVMMAGGLLISLASPAAPAQADTPGCVTKPEFSRVQTGMLKEGVHRIFDTRGSLTGLGTSEIRHYKPCKAAGVVQVTYRSNGRVESKSGTWITV